MSREKIKAVLEAELILRNFHRSSCYPSAEAFEVDECLNKLVAAGWRYVPPDHAIVPVEYTREMDDKIVPPAPEWVSTELGKKVRESAFKARADAYRAMLQSAKGE